jgi:hypothetical protein
MYILLNASLSFSFPPGDYDYVRARQQYRSSPNYSDGKERGQGAQRQQAEGGTKVGKEGQRDKRAKW